MLVLRRASEDPTVHTLRPERGLATRLRRRLNRMAIRNDFARHRRMRSPGFDLFSDDRALFAREVPQQIPPCDVVNLHWVRGLVDVRSFFQTLAVPIVWTLHDMNAFTGGCHYSDGCDRYTASCGMCPQLGSCKQGDLSRQVWARKMAALRGRLSPRVSIVAPSVWLAREAERSSILGRLPIYVIPYGLDTETFRPRDRAASRRGLGIPEGARVLLFVAQSTENRRKGFPLLIEALGSLSGRVPDLLLVSVGQGSPETGGLPHLSLGSVSTDDMLATIYSAADLFVAPSLQDNLPNTVLESLACGTPVVGFKTGGLPDMVRSGSTGALVPTGDVRSLSEAIVSLLNDQSLRSGLSNECRRIAVSEYALHHQAERYQALYADLVEPQQDIQLRAG